MRPDVDGLRLLITGGAGFIGSHLVDWALEQGAARVAVLDALTYAANPLSLEAARGDARFALHELDILDQAGVREVLDRERPNWLFHLAAETHVDRSIDGPQAFVRTNVQGTAALLQACLEHWSRLPAGERRSFRLVHASTDEVFGPLGAEGFFREDSPYRPTSPYAASKAASDHLVWAWHRTYGLPVQITHCGNNYGPRQFPEKLVGLMISRALAGRTLPVYGEGRNVRDWIYVQDHCRALVRVAAAGRVGAAYCIGAHCTLSNLELVQRIGDTVDALSLRAPGVQRTRDLIRFVADRPGHDLRYALDATRLQDDTGWQPQQELQPGLRQTVSWYAENAAWLEACRSTGYDGERLGLGPPALRDAPLAEGDAGAAPLLRPGRKTP